jgi:hypothetical protein
VSYTLTTEAEGYQFWKRRRYFLEEGEKKWEERQRERQRGGEGEVREESDVMR